MAIEYTIRDLHEKGLLVMEAICGSRSFGLHTETSDTDIHGVYLLPVKDRVRVSPVQEVIESEGHDHQYWDLSKFLKMLSKANPSALELLYTPQFLSQNREVVAMLRENDQFVTKQCASSFAQYAMQQVKKAKGLNKKVFNPMPEKRLGIMDFCYFMVGPQAVPASEHIVTKGWDPKFLAVCSVPHSHVYAVFYQDPLRVKASQKGKDPYPGADDRYAYGIVRDEEASMELQMASVPKGEMIIGYLAFNEDAFAKHCKDHKNYWDWVKDRNEDRFQGNMAHAGGYDSKNMMHVVRLLHTARDIALGKGVIVDRSFEREYLLGIKKGVYTYEQLVARSEELMNEIQKAYEVSTLPEESNVNLDEMLVKATYLMYGKEHSL
jgi:uncharacterized protein